MITIIEAMTTATEIEIGPESIAGQGLGVEIEVKITGTGITAIVIETTTEVRTTRFAGLG